MLGRTALILVLLVTPTTAVLDSFEWSYAFTGFAAGADSVSGLVWPIYLIGASGVITPDQACGATDGISSGADGLKCVAFNEADFLLLNGSSCLTRDNGSPRYSHDPALPGCASALAAFRNSTGFTCDCLGDYAYLGGTGGVRASVVWTSLTALGNAITCVLSPLVGTVIDYQGGKRLWWALTIASGIGTIFMACIGSGFLWVVGVSFGTLVQVTTQLAIVPRTAYLDDVETKLASWREGETTLQATARVAGYRTIMLYLSQAILFAIGLALIFTLRPPIPAIAMSVLCGVWYMSMYSLALSKLHTRPARRALLGRRPLAASFRSLLGDFRALFRHHPEAAKYLLFLAVAQNGLGSTIGYISGPYLIAGPPKANTLQVAAELLSNYFP